jgi:chromosome segregation ATPase
MRSNKDLTESLKREKANNKRLAKELADVQDELGNLKGIRDSWDEWQSLEKTLQGRIKFLESSKEGRHLKIRDLEEEIARLNENYQGMVNSFTATQKTMQEKDELIKMLMRYHLEN